MNIYGISLDISKDTTFSKKKSIKLINVLKRLEMIKLLKNEVLKLIV